MTTIEELQDEANALGVKYAKNATEATLRKLINAAYEREETSGPALQKTIEEQKAKTPKKQQQAVNAVVDKRAAREKAARETRVVTIVDNDQRVNNHTTTCTVNCSNEFFDLGTIILPLNEKIEVAVGHLQTLEEVKIPLHVRDNKTGLSAVKLRPRYTISYEDIKK